MDYRFTAILIILMLLMAFLGGPTQWLNLLTDEIYINNIFMFLYKWSMLRASRNKTRI